MSAIDFILFWISLNFSTYCSSLIYPRVAIEGGYSKAIVTILDANITTFIAALVLFQFGTGPIRGFAVTLSIGIVASLVTAVFVTRVFFDYLYIQRNWKRISI